MRRNVLQVMAVIPLFLFFLSVEGCGLLSDEEDSLSTPPRMEIAVQLQDVHRCSLISPEIRVSNAPKETKFYFVRLVERKGKDEILLGEGSWREDGSGVIPEGVLTGHYRGPCPSEGHEREYIFEVHARMDQNPRSLAVAYESFLLK